MKMLKIDLVCLKEQWLRKKNADKNYIVPDYGFIQSLPSSSARVDMCVLDFDKVKVNSISQY